MVIPLVLPSLTLYVHQFPVENGEGFIFTLVKPKHSMSTLFTLLVSILSIVHF